MSGKSHSYGGHVTAVLVALDAAQWLPETMAGLAALHRRPDRLIAIDNDSADATGSLLQSAQAAGVLDAVYSAQQTTGFGTAVESALRQDQHGDLPATSTPAEDRSSWLWLLHDDAVPDPYALDRLLEQVSGSPGIDVTGPKLLMPSDGLDPAKISEVGAAVSGTGRREAPGHGELDLGQHDKPSTPLGVSTCGMLVRRSVWQRLGGLDVGLPVFRDGVDFGWRAHLAGFSVQTSPSSVFVHRQVGRAGLRPRGAGGAHPARLDRYLGLLVVVGRARPRMLPAIWVRLVSSCKLNALGHLAAGSPGRSVDELVALGWFLAHPDRIARMRRRMQAVPEVPGADAVLHQLKPPWWSDLQLAARALSHLPRRRRGRSL